MAKKHTKAWEGRFKEPTHRLVEIFTSSLAVDRRLFSHDIEGSLAHCATLVRAKVLKPREGAEISKGLAKVKAELESSKFRFLAQDEDIHMAIERRLTELIGPLGGKLHTGRSRNDQVALDLRLYVRDAIAELSTALRELQSTLVSQAQAHDDVVMPGYTHLQRAQPVLFAHHLLAYVEMLERDRGRLHDAAVRVNVMPLGSGALAGNNYPIDRAYTAKLLGFPKPTANSLDAVSDRDFVVEVLSALSLVMMHLSRFSEELVLWTSQEFQFVSLPDAFCTGSSMMPQKKNPDVPELVRGKTGRVYGHLMALLTTLKGLPLSYNRDLQEDKGALFDALDTVSSSVNVYTAMVARLKVNGDVMRSAAESGGMLATELADYLVLKGVPFREAHAITGRVVGFAIDEKRELTELSLTQLRRFSSHFGNDVMARLTVESAIDHKAQEGGTARPRVAKALKEWATRLALRREKA